MTMLKALMFKLGWIHKSDIEQIAAETVSKAVKMGMMLGRNEVYCQQYKDALAEQEKLFERRVH